MRNLDSNEGFYICTSMMNWSTKLVKLWPQDQELYVAVHIGNSDLVALFVYKNSKQLLDTISESKKIPGVERVLWSEEVYFIKMNESKINMLNTNNN